MLPDRLWQTAQRYWMARKGGTVPTPASGLVVAYYDDYGVLRTKDSAGATYPIGQRNRNTLHNPTIQVNQKPLVAKTSTGFITDRWVYVGNGAATVQSTASADVPTPAQAGANVRYSLDIVRTNAAAVGGGDYNVLQHSVEGYDWRTCHEQPMVCSFWTKGSTPGTYGFTINNQVDRSYAATWTLLAANVWEFKVVVIPASTGGTWNLTNGYGAVCEWAAICGSTNQSTANAWASVAASLAPGGMSNGMTGNGDYLRIAAPKLEPGLVPTPIEVLPYDVELSICRRYLERLAFTAANIGVGTAHAYSTTAALTDLRFHPKRAAPTFSVSAAGDFQIYNAGASSALAVTSVTLTAASLDLCRLAWGVASGLVAGNAAFVESVNANSIIDLAAEL